MRGGGVGGLGAIFLIKNLRLVICYRNKACRP